MSLSAQIHFLDFENQSKAAYGADTLSIDGLSWWVSEGVIGTSASDLKLGQRSLRLRAPAGDTAWFLLAQDKPEGLDRLSFYYGRSDFSGDRTGAAPSLWVRYSQDMGQSWATLATLSLASVDSLAFFQADSLGLIGDLRLAWGLTCVTGGKRANIDDIVIEPKRTHIRLLESRPRGPGIDPSLQTLGLDFDLPIHTGHGSLHLHYEDGTWAGSFDVPSPEVSVIGSRALFNGLHLENDRAYYFLLDEGSFWDTSGTFPNKAIIRTENLAFHTADTFSRSDWDERFESCDTTLPSLGSFLAHNSAGHQEWRCGSPGHGDAFCASMRGGIAEGLSETNMDWLIGNRAIDIAGMSRPFLGFWQKKRFEGSVEREARISRAYRPGLIPDSLEWQVLEIQALTAEPSTDWTFVEHALPDSLKRSPFYLAFTYSCGQKGAYELFYDDISITDGPLSFSGAVRNGPAILQVLGAGHGHLDLYIDCKQPLQGRLSLWNAQGQRSYAQELSLGQGGRFIRLGPLHLSPGIYTVQLQHQGGHLSKRCLVY